MKDGYELRGMFGTRRFEDKAVLRAMEIGDPVEVELTRQAAFDKALREGLPLDFEMVEETMKQNTISLQYYNFVFDTMLRGVAYTPNVRIGVFGNDTTPGDGLTNATFRSTLSELVNYAGTNRITTNFDIAAGQSISNTTNPSRFTFNGVDVVEGAFLTHGATLNDGSQDGSAIYIAGGRFSAPQTVANGSIIDVVYTQSKV